MRMFWKNLGRLTHHACENKMYIWLLVVKKLASLHDLNSGSGIKLI
jgi:hypothetical protein